MGKKQFLIIIVVIFTSVFLSCLLVIYLKSTSLPSANIADGLVAIISAFVGMLVTIAVTAVLLKAQSKEDSIRERKIKQFEKKQETYYTFLHELELIMEHLIDMGLKGNDDSAYKNVNSLEKLIFQFGYLRIHMDDETFKQVINYTSNMVKAYHEKHLLQTFKTEIIEPNKSRSRTISSILYSLNEDISQNLFSISGLLNNDMYQQRKIFTPSTDISESIKRLLYICGLKK